MHDSSKQCRPAPCPAQGWEFLRNRPAALAMLLLVIVGGVILRTYGLYGRSMWFDEATSWRGIHFAFVEMIDRTAQDNHAPLFFVLLRVWAAAFGESIIALRSFSLVFSAVAMLGVYLFTVEAMAMGRRPADGGARADSRARCIGLVATALFAVSLYQIRLAWEIRMYSLGTALAMFSSWLLLRALTARPQRGLLWTLYAIVALMFAYTHYSALFSLFAQSFFALAFLLSGTCEGTQGVPGPIFAATKPSLVPELGQSPTYCFADLKAALKDVRFRWLAFADAGIAAGWSAWLPVFLAQRRRVAGGWHDTPFSVENVPGICYEMFFHPDVHGRALCYALIVAALCGIVVVAMLWKGGAGQWCVACLAVVPLALISLVSSVSSNLMIARYMAFLQPFLLIAIAAALWRIRAEMVRFLVAYGLISAGLLLHVDFVDALEIANRPGASAAAAYIDAERRAGEPVVACSPLLMLPTLFHSREREGWHVYSDRPQIPFYAGGSVMMDGETFFDDDMDAVRAKRAWVITSSGDWARWGLYIPPKWTKIAEQRFPEVYAFQNDVKVLCYVIPEG